MDFKKGRKGSSPTMTIITVARALKMRKDTLARKTWTWIGAGPKLRAISDARTVRRAVGTGPELRATSREEGDAGAGSRVESTQFLLRYKLQFLRSRQYLHSTS